MDTFQFGVTTGDASAGYPFTFHQPVITGKRAAIAQAAQEAGFDCSNPAKLLHLIDAVVLANNAFGYPDRWDGPAAFQSSVYPDSWTPAHAARQVYQEEKRARVTLDDGEDGEVMPAAVPAFAPSATDIVQNLTKQESWKKPNKKAKTLPMKGTTGARGANRQPLGERTTNKRLATTVLQASETQSFKRPKTEELMSQPMHIIDLTQDENAQPTHQQAAGSNVSRPVTTTRRRRPNRPNPQMRAAAPHQAEAIAAGTTDLLHQTVARLAAGVANVNADREALRVRWEVDKRLQLLRVTEHLSVLSKCFTMAEDGLRGAVDVIERFIV